MKTLTYGVRNLESVDAVMRQNIQPLRDAVARQTPMIDADTTAFNGIVSALRLPKDTAEQRALRTERLQAGLKKAIDIPLRTMKIGVGAWDAFYKMARHGNPASRSDVAVGSRALEYLCAEVLAIHEKRYPPDSCRQAASRITLEQRKS